MPSRNIDWHQERDLTKMSEPHPHDYSHFDLHSAQRRWNDKHAIAHCGANFLVIYYLEIGNNDMSP